jgi:hypothetical protein
MTYHVGDMVEWDTVFGVTRGHIVAVVNAEYIIEYGPWADVTTCPCHKGDHLRLVRPPTK